MSFRFVALNLFLWHSYSKRVCLAQLSLWVIILHVIWNHSITTPPPTSKVLNVHCWSSSSVPSVLLAPLPHLLHANLLLFFSILSHCVTLITFTSQAHISLHLLLVHKVASPKAVSDAGINTLKILLKDTFDVQSPSCVFCFVLNTFPVFNWKVLLFC